MAERRRAGGAPGGADTGGEATRILRALEHSPQAGAAEAERLWELVHGALRGLAGTLLEGERGDHTLQPTALVHEAYLRLVGQDRVAWQGRAHFFAIAAQAMRRILIDHARARGRDKRGAGRERVELETSVLGAADVARLDVVAVHEALERLATVSEDQARIAELRFFGGLPMESVAEVLGRPLRSIEREWRFARAWLASALEESP